MLTHGVRRHQEEFCKDSSDAVWGWQQLLLLEAKMPARGIYVPVNRRFS